MKKITLFLFFISMLYSKEYFYNLQKVQTSTNLLTKRYCALLFQQKGESCQSFSLEYAEILNQDINLSKITNSYIKEFETLDPKKIIDETIKEENIGPVKYYENDYIELIALNKNSFSLENSFNIYSGGAHGMYGFFFENYTKDYKEIKIDELFIKDYNKTLHNIALNAYKEYRGLEANESLINDCWFEDKFMLTQNFAITNKGLYFIYNPYEVAAYACGAIDFLIPYSKLKPIIKKDSILKEFLNKKKELTYFFFNKNIALVKAIVKKIDKDNIKVEINLYDWRNFKGKLWLSLSFPNLKDKNNISNLNNKNFNNIKIYPQGSKKFNVLDQKTIKTKYLLVEASKNNLKDANLSFNIQNPKKILLRIVSKNKKIEDNMPITRGVIDEQGYLNYVILVD